jgi:hypothetical protein
MSAKTKMSKQEETALRNRRTALQREIYKWTNAQNEYMPHIKHVRTMDDVMFESISGVPPAGDLMYVGSDRPSIILAQPLPPHFGGSSSTQTSTEFPPLPPTVNTSTPTPANVAPEVVASSLSETTKRKRTSEPTSCITVPDATNDVLDVEQAERIHLWLPSNIPYKVRCKVCSKEAIAAELRLVIAELHDALIGIRKFRRLWSATRSFYKGEYKATSASSIKTRKRSELTFAGDKVELNRVRYVAAWYTADTLDHDGPWSAIYLYLEKSDIRGPNPGDDTGDLPAVGGPHARPRDRGRGQYKDSWIWRTIAADDEPIDYVRVQWAKVHASKERWREELALVREEMKRTIRSFEWQSQWWRARINTRSDAPEDLRLAVHSYATRQSHLWQQRANLFARTWMPHLVAAGCGDLLPDQYLTQYNALTLANPVQHTDPALDIQENDVCGAVEGGLTWDGLQPQSAVPLIEMADDDGDELDEEEEEE